MSLGRVSFDTIAAEYLESAGNVASGLNLDEIGESGHGTANKLWKIAAYLRKRDREAAEREAANEAAKTVIEYGDTTA